MLQTFLRLADDLDEEYEEEELEAEDYNPSEILEQLRVHAPGEYWVRLDWIEAAYFDHVLKMNESEKDATADDLDGTVNCLSKDEAGIASWSDSDQIDEDERLLQRRAKSRALELATRFARTFSRGSERASSQLSN